MKLKNIIPGLFLASISSSCANAQTNAGLLTEMTRVIDTGYYTGIHSVLISKNGKTKYAHYFNGFTADSIHDSRSAFKSITSLLAGIALDQGLIKDINKRVYTFFPQDQAFAGDARKREMTVRDLLEMRSGFDCDEWNDDGKDCEDEMTKTHDWLKFSLALPMKYEPGKVWAYTSCNPMIISGIISRVSHMSIMDFAAKYLFGPLGIKNYRWTVDPAGHGMTAGSFYILPKDMLKIGQLVLNGGTWNGRRIVSEKWIKASTAAIKAIPDQWSFVKFSRSKVAAPQQTYYGYYWYNEVIKTSAYTGNVIFASGNGGQYIMIIKDMGLTVVFMQGNYQSWKAKRAFDLVAKYIIPAFR